MLQENHCLDKSFEILHVDRNPLKIILVVVLVINRLNLINEEFNISESSLLRMF